MTKIKTFGKQNKFKILVKKTIKNFKKTGFITYGWSCSQQWRKQNNNNKIFM